MIKHIVMFKFLPEAQGRTKNENVAIAKEMLEKLQGVIPTLVSSSVHAGYEDAAPTNYDLVLEATYASKEDLHAYIVHPEHKKVGEFMRGVRESRTCVDYEM